MVPLHGTMAATTAVTAPLPFVMVLLREGLDVLMLLMVTAVTQLVMLSEPEAFEGAELQHLTDGRIVGSCDVDRGDALVYRGSQYHRVTKLRSGRRLTLAVEWWHVQGVDYTGDHATRRPSFGPADAKRSGWSNAGGCPL